MTPDLEQILISHLAASPEVQAVCGTRVGARHPRNTSDPWVRVMLIDDRLPARSTALHTVTGLLQLDCYGSDNENTAQEQASTLARVCRQALHALVGEQAGGVVVARCKAEAMRRLPDLEFSPARERFILDVDVVAHP